MADKYTGILKYIDRTNSGADYTEKVEFENLDPANTNMNNPNSLTIVYNGGNVFIIPLSRVVFFKMVKL